MPDPSSTLAPAFSAAPAPTVRAAIYCRVSSTGQQDNGSLETQEARCRAWCAEHGYTVLEPPYREVYSGEDVYRPQLQQLQDEVRAGRVDVIVADKMDRFSRADPAITFYVMMEAEQYGAKVVLIEAPEDTFEGQILRAVHSITARVEHKRIKDRTSEGKRRRVLGDPAKGKPSRLLPGNVPRYGWRYADAEKTRYVLDPEQSAIVARIYRELGEGGRSLNAICRDLEAEKQVPPTEALARQGYAVGNRKASMRWHPASVVRMLKEPCYWGEARAYHHESYKSEQRDPQTNRVRRVKRTRYRDPESDVIVRYPPDVWPGIVSKDRAEKALARLKQNQVEAERNSKHIGLSFLRAGLVICGYCGANMVLHNHADKAGGPQTLRFVCGRHRAFKAKRTQAEEDCPSGGQFAVRLDVLEATIWTALSSMLADPKIVPDAYEALTATEADVRQHYEDRVKSLSDLIDKAKARRERFAEALGDTADADMRLVFKEKMAAESANLRTWEDERARLEAEAQTQLASTAAVRAAMQDFASRIRPLITYTTAQRRKLAMALGLRVVVYRSDHSPWFALVCDLPGVEASWHAVPLKDAGMHYSLLEKALLLSPHQPDAPTPPPLRRSGRLLVPVRDHLPPRTDWPYRTLRVYSNAVRKWTAPVPTSKEEAGQTTTREPVSAGSGAGE